MVKLCAFCLALVSGFACLRSAIVSPDDFLPQPAAAAPPIATAKDEPYPGIITLIVDATDTDHAVLSVHETLPVAGLKQLTLLYPEWVVGNHGPSGLIDKLAGLTIHAGAQELNWVRDPINMYAFHVVLPQHVAALDVDFQYLTPPTAKDGRVRMSADMLDLDWHAVLLYPAGHFARRIRFEPGLKLPAGFTAFTSMALAPASAPDSTRLYQPLTLEELVDSPVVAGRYVKRGELDPGAAQPVTLDIVADALWQLDVGDSQLAAHRALISQTLSPARARSLRPL